MIAIGASIAMVAISSGNAQETPPPWFAGQWSCTLVGKTDGLVIGYAEGDPRDNPPSETSSNGLGQSTSDDPGPLGAQWHYTSGGGIIYFRMFSQDARSFALSTHDEGNIWFLQQAGGPNHLTGNATFSGTSAQPLECWRVGTPTAREMTQIPYGSKGLQKFETSYVFSSPQAPNGMPLDYCLQYGDMKSCGQPAEDAFCRSKGYSAAIGNKGYTLRTETATMSGARCTWKRCWAFASIQCQR